MSCRAESGAAPGVPFLGLGPCQASWGCGGPVRWATVTGTGGVTGVRRSRPMTSVDAKLSIVVVVASAALRCERRGELGGRLACDAGPEVRGARVVGWLAVGTPGQQ